MQSKHSLDFATLIRTNGLHDALIPLGRLPALIPSSRPGKRVALPTIYRWVKKGRLPAKKVGGALFVTVDDLADFVGTPHSHTSKADSPRPATRSAERARQALQALLARPDVPAKRD